MNISTVHILAVSTPQTCAMLGCWQGWIRRTTQATPRAALHVATYTPNVSGRGLFRDPASIEAWQATVKHASRFMDSTLADPESVIINTDLDVINLRPFTELVHYVRGESEIAFMEECKTEGRCRGAEVNAGFYLARSTPPVREFLREWQRSLRGCPLCNNQRVLRRLLDGPFHPDTRRLRWSILPLEVATGQLARVRPSTVAYHSLAASGAPAKFRKFAAALQRVAPEDGLLRCNASSPQALATCELASVPGQTSRARRPV